MKINYEYCAYRFLELWEKTEKALHKDMQGTPSAYHIRKVLSHYRVARNFKGISDKRAEKISADLAAHGLVSVPRKYTAAPSLADGQLTKLVHAKWFRERVFDIYLWEIGSAKNAEAIQTFGAENAFAS